MLLTFLAALSGLLLLLLLKTLFFTKQQLPEKIPEPLPLSLEQATERLSRAIQFKTVSRQNPAEVNYDEFYKLHDFLKTAFPRVHEELRLEKVNELSLLYFWEGSNPDLKPMMLTAHQDVVPVEPGTEADWKHPPFSGNITETHIYGRGTMDVQSGVMGILEAAEALLEKGFQPERSIYFGFGHDEEIDGIYGAKAIGELLKQRGVELEFLVDEGLPVVAELVEGIKSPVALVAVAEKGYLSIALSLESEGGHSSVPQGKTSIARLGKALHRLENHPLPARFNGLVRETFEALGRGMSLPFRIIFANLWLFKWPLKYFLTTLPPTNAAVRTTTASTIFNSGVKENLIPTSAEAIVNFRIHPNDTAGSVAAHVRRIVKDDDIKIEKKQDFIDPSPVSDTQNEAYRQLSKSILEIFPEVTVAPSLMVGATDARHYTEVSKNIYRFFPLRADHSDLDRVHGTNERLSIENYGEMIQFYARLIQNGSGAWK
ncbi:MAG: M20 family peptidase [Cyclonatronaceae bacterium]